MFENRHIGPTESDVAEMLRACGADSIEVFLRETLPEDIYKEVPLNLAPPKSEPEVLNRLIELAEKNQIYTSLIGQGYYNSHTPSVIKRNVIEHPAWYSAYTPYQAEISQGRLEVLLAFQTMICELTGMEIANASLLDEASAVVESMTLLARVSKESDRKSFAIDSNAYQQTRDLLASRAEPLGIELIDIDIDSNNELETEILQKCFGIFLQLESCEGKLRDLAPIIEQAHLQNTLVSVSADPLTLCLVQPPGQLGKAGQTGADVVVGTTQRFGTPLAFGGPHAGYIGIKDEYKRELPGRLVGVSKDTNNKEAYRLSLQTREQHIRKEKATSNICTAQVLLAMVSAMYAIYHSSNGLLKIAQRTHFLAGKFQASLNELGIKTKHKEFFSTLAIEVEDAEAICARAREHKINLHKISATEISLSFDETTTNETLNKLLFIFSHRHKDASFDTSFDIGKLAGKNLIPQHLQRTSAPLRNPIFNREWSEAEFTRYLTRLAKKDLSLDHSMIPLGSCTMKLNSATELTPITWQAFSEIHPFVPLEQAEGYMELLDELSAGLIEITGMDAASLQPNAGSQGELAGLLAIQKYHIANNDTNRDICLIPTSAHGTNAASAVLAGMKVLSLKCDERGDIDILDLKEKLETHSQKIATLMVTYPSTHGIFESQILKICELVHKAGGQVYMDGANLNALIGLARPGDFGVDVSHLNLHKTFCIPHGGGGPGVGPIVVKKHLEPYLPGHFYLDDYLGSYLDSYPNSYLGENKKVGSRKTQVAAAPWGSPGVLPISWSYIQLMGADGLKHATQIAILSANYLMNKLKPHFPILYTGKNERVAHECVLDLRRFKNLVSVEDVAKRLMDYGFHAPTVSFPVADTLMVEPTESESKAELDRFVAAMASIREEIRKIETGEWDAKNNPLKNAPHTAQDVTADEWDRPYSRQTAAYPLDYIKDSKYWPPVNRIDSVWGDRNLFCSCPEIMDFE